LRPDTSSIAFLNEGWFIGAKIMGLVNELQESTGREDVQTVLRKAKRLSSKLALQDISDWLEREQSGYPSDAPIPDYRDVGITICYDTNGYIPAGYGMLKNGIEQLKGYNIGLTLPMREPIGTVLSHIEAIKSGKAIYVPLPNALSHQIRAKLEGDYDVIQQLTFLAQMSSSKVGNIPEQVKNKVLDWACKLESAGVTGDGASFSEKEKGIAQHVIFNISNSTVEQINSSGKNIKGADNG